MREHYELFGCIDFGNKKHVISIPLLRQAKSNCIYIPETDHFFTVVDFYKIDDFGYHILPVSASDKKLVRLGDKTPVPIIDKGRVLVVDPGTPDEQLATLLPELTNEAIKAFISLRSRIALQAEVSQKRLAADMEDLLKNPSHSRYWISRYTALITSLFSVGEPSVELVNKVDQARMTWLEKFGTKAALKRIQTILDIPYLETGPQIRNTILMARFEKLVTQKGIYMSRAELRAYRELFPNGVLSEGQIAEQDNWISDRRREISRLLSDQIFSLINVRGKGVRQAFSPTLWSTLEVARLLEFYRTIYGTEHSFDRSYTQLVPLYEECLSYIQNNIPSRYEILEYIGMKILPTSIVKLFDRSTPRKTVNSNDIELYWMQGFSIILDEYQKLLLIYKLVHPYDRDVDNSKIGFPGVDHALIDAVREAVRTRDIGAIRRRLQAPSH